MNQPFTYDEFAECRLPAELENISRAAGKLREYCLSRGLAAQVWMEVELAVVEALNNAVEHGCADRPGASVFLRWRWSGETLHLAIHDPGEYTPGDGAASLPEDIYAEGGRGSFLISQLMDEVEHTREDGAHVIRMRKKIGEAAWSSARIAELEGTLDSMAEDLSRSYEELSALFRFAEELATASDFGQFLERSFTRLLSLVRAEMAYVRFVSPDNTGLDLLRSIDGIPKSLSLDLPCVECNVFRARTPYTVEHGMDLPSGDPLRHFPGGTYATPIFFQSTVLGCLVVVGQAGNPYFSAGELSLIRFVADFVGIVRTTNDLQEKRKAEQRTLREIEIAASIQQSLLPRQFPSSERYRVRGVSQSARLVGGDFFDALKVGEDGILLVIADVMGKGVPAALMATVLRTAIRSQLHLAPQPGVLLTAVNRQIAPDLAAVDMFITAQIAYVSEKENKVRFSNAGHCPLLHCRRATGDILQLHTDGIPIGVFESFVYEEATHPLMNGDLLVFLTDGLYEIERDGEMLGLKRLVEEVGRMWMARPRDICGPLLSFVQAFGGDLPAADDRTLLTVNRLET